MKYGNDGYYRENPEGHEGTLEVGYGGVPKTDEDKCRGDQRLAETPGTAFSRFLGGRGGCSGNDSSDGGENKVEGSVRRAEKMTSGEPKSVRFESGHPDRGKVRSRSSLIRLYKNVHP